MIPGKAAEIDAQATGQAVTLATGMTTCPRQGFCYALDTLDSLAYAGFPDPTIFEDPGRELGAYGNARKALAAMMESDPDADGYLIFQDDFVAARGLSDYLEKTLWPGDVARIGVMSLFTPSPRARDGAGWQVCDLHENHGVTGGLALILPAHAAWRLLNDPPRAGSKQGWDISVREMCVREELQWWYHHPSLVRHTGDVSSIAVWPMNWPARQCKTFCEDASEL